MNKLIISKEKRNTIAYKKYKKKYGCGYWKVCINRGDDCNLKLKEFDNEIYNHMISHKRINKESSN